MLESLAVRRFRGLRSLDLQDLTRINLLMGVNNVGKSAVLDAIELLMRDGHPQALLDLAVRRGGPKTGLDQQLPSSVQHLFFGFAMPGEKLEEIKIFSAGSPKRSLNLQRIDHSEDYQQPDVGVVRSIRDNSPNTDLGYGSVSVGQMTLPGGSRSLPVQYVSPAKSSPQSLAPLWDRIAGNPEEEEVIAALRLVDDRLRRVVFTRQSAEGVQVHILREGDSRRAPLASMGDGVQRMLGIAMQSVSARGGALLLDELDSGLHFSAMQRFWAWLIHFATSTNTQIFATTHSLDCVHALGWLHRQDPALVSEVSAFRIDAGRPVAVRYGPAELEAAASAMIEVRG